MNTPLENFQMISLYSLSCGIFDISITNMIITLMFMIFSIIALTTTLLVERKLILSLSQDIFIFILLILLYIYLGLSSDIFMSFVGEYWSLLPQYSKDPSVVAHLQEMSNTFSSLEQSNSALKHKVGLLEQRVLFLEKILTCLSTLCVITLIFIIINSIRKH